MYDALSRYSSVTPIYVRNHLRWEDAELFWLKSYHRGIKSSKLEALKIFDLPMRDLYDRHWSITGIKVPGSRSSDESMYLPGRNIILLAKAACHAAMMGAAVIEIGVLKSNPFSDSSKAFFKKMSEVLSLGLGKPIKIVTPFQTMRKEDVILLGLKSSLALEQTFSCVNPKNFDHCGECNKCIERKKAFFSAGIFDKTKYRKEGILAS